MFFDFSAVGLMTLFVSWGFTTIRHILVLISFSDILLVDCLINNPLLFVFIDDKSLQLSNI